MTLDENEIRTSTKETNSDTPLRPPSEEPSVKKDVGRAESVENEKAEGSSNDETTVDDGEVIELKPSSPTIKLEYKHALAVRWMHWINFPVLTIMIYSGILIYWADSKHEGLNAHQVYRLGLGKWTLLRFFPAWFYDKLHLKFQLANGLGYHFYFMWFFAINGIVYVLYTAISGQWRYLIPNRASFKEAIQVTLHDLGLRKYHPPRRKFNGGQQIAYTSVIIMGLGSLLTGLAIYKPTQLAWLTQLFGGYEMARWFHFWLTIGYVVFFLVHVAQVIRAGWNNFRAMIIGYELIPVEAAAPDEVRHHG